MESIKPNSASTTTVPQPLAYQVTNTTSHNVYLSQLAISLPQEYFQYDGPVQHRHQEGNNCETNVKQGAEQRGWKACMIINQNAEKQI